MRRHGLFWAAACAAWVGATVGVAQNSVDYGQVEEQIPPYPTHQDRRHGHDRVYPDRGAIVRDLPHGATILNYAGISYRFVGGVWYEPRGPAYIVVAPPIGLVVPALPGFATAVRSRGRSYLYADDIYYRARPDLGGYEVVNDPQDAPPVIARPAEHAPSQRSENEYAVEAATPPSERPRVTPLNAPSANPAPEPAPQSAPTSVPASHVDTQTRPDTATRTETATRPEAAAPSESVTRPDRAMPVESQVRGEQPAADPTRPVRIEARVPATVPPGTVPLPPAPTPAASTRISALPQNGQSPDEEARDRYICYRFAVAQSGFDPLGVQGEATSTDAAQRQADFGRAQAACLQERGYQLR